MFFQIPRGPEPLPLHGSVPGPGDSSVDNLVDRSAKSSADRPIRSADSPEDIAHAPTEWPCSLDAPAAAGYSWSGAHSGQVRSVLVGALRPMRESRE